MASRKQFGALGALEIPRVKETGRELGRGSYGVVMEVNVNGMIYAAKRLHNLLLGQDQQSAERMINRFVEEILQHSSLRHPNIVQLIGVHYYKPEQMQLPMMILEKMGMSLGNFLERFPRCPVAQKHSILIDINQGLLHLHSQDPPIIHRDLTAGNVLLTPQLTAKIADLGVIKVLEASGQASMLTQTPGTLVYMPPEALSSSPVYNTKLDIFSFGVLMLYTFTNKFPKPIDRFEKSATSTDSKAYTMISEIERRRPHLLELGREHTHMGLIIDCLENDPDSRPTAKQALLRLEAITEYTGCFPSIVEFVAHMEKEKEIKPDNDNIQMMSLIREKMQLLTQVDSLNKQLRAAILRCDDCQATLQVGAVCESCFKKYLACERCQKTKKDGAICDSCCDQYKSVNFTLLMCTGCGKGFKKPGPVHVAVADNVKCDQCAKDKRDHLKRGDVVSICLGSGKKHVFTVSEFKELQAFIKGEKKT